MTVPYYQKEAIDIPDLPALVRQLLIDPLRNHLLYRIVPEDKIVMHYEGTWQELIGIYITEVSMTPILTEEVISQSGGIGSTWEATIEIQIITSDDSYCNYPPPDPGEADDESTRFNGAENVLNVLKWLVFRTIGENRKGYKSDTLATFQWDEAIFVSGELIDGNYDGVKDMWAYIMTYTFECEVVSRT